MKAQVITKEEFQLKKHEILSKVEDGAIFIHPTDTIYGIGCDATNESAVKKVREAKQRYSKPFSVIAPSKTWIRENCEVNPEVIKYLKKLPGPYTLILKLKKDNHIAKNVKGGLPTLGVRIPDHWSTKIAEELDKPIITTSANIVGKEFMTSLDNLDISIKNKIDFILYEGEKRGRPSTLIDLSQEETLVTKR